MTLPISLSRRAHLAGLLALGLSGCATRNPNAEAEPVVPRQAPNRIALLAISPIAEVSYQYRRGAKGFFGVVTGGAGALIAHGMERSDSQSLTQAVNRVGLKASDHLRAAVANGLRKPGLELTAVDDRPRIDGAVKEWKFQRFAAECDAAVYIDLSEVAYSAWSEGVSPKITASMWLMSTKDNAELGTATYQILLDLDKTDPRSMPPLRSSRFNDHEHLLGSPDQVAAALRADGGGSGLAG